MNVDDVATDSDLADEIGGPSALANIIPADYAGSAALPRAQVLRQVLQSLAGRTPPIYAGSISNPMDLRDAVVFGTLEKLYRLSMTTPDGVYALQRKIYEGRFSDALRGMTISAGGGEDGGGGRLSAFSYVMERR